MARRRPSLRAPSRRDPRGRELRFEPLERRLLLAVDTGDAPYVGTASHEAIGPMLGVMRAANAQPDSNFMADIDPDEDGVTFSVLRAGQTGAMTVYVTNAPAGARLDAWVDFAKDGSWTTTGDQVADDLPVVEGENVVSFTVPATINGNYTYARIRLSTAGNLNPTGAAADGEVEDYLVQIAGADAGPFAGPQPVRIDGASLVLPVDFDGDGDPDILTNDDYWVENVAGRFGSEIQTYYSGVHPFRGAAAIIPADIDGDGATDYFVSYSSSVWWYKILSNQTLERKQIDSTSASTMLLIDGDGDGDLDLLVSSSSILNWDLNKGAQTFVRGPGISTSSIGVARALALADMDGDGDDDVLASFTNGRIVWYEVAGLTSFTPHDVATTGTNLRMTVPTDLDGDGDMDVVVARNASGGGVFWLENDGTQTFTSHALDAAAWGAEAVTAADLDGDGDLDLAASGNARVSWYENDGAQHFTSHMIARPRGTLTSLAAADLDGDARLDLLTGGSSTGNVAWYRQIVSADYGDAPLPYNTALQGNGARHLPNGPQLGALRDVETDDLPSLDDGDDGVVLPVLQASSSLGNVVVNVQNAPAGAKLDAWIDFDGDGSWGVANEQIFADMPVVEGDNALTFAIPSLAVAGTTYARFRLSTAGGLGVNGVALDGEVEDYAVTIAPRAPATGYFGDPLPIASPPTGSFRFMVPVDVDGDGDMDIATTSSSFPSNLTWYENLGPQGFAPHVVLDSSLTGEDFAAADLDSDGDVDFVGFASGQLVWLDNDGSQNFMRRTWNVSSSSMPLTDTTGLSVADMDGDGDMDVLACHVRNPSNVYLLLNNGRQEFSVRLLGTMGYWATSVIATDIDGDGDLDVIAGSYFAFTLFQNVGGLGFTTHVIYHPAGLPGVDYVEDLVTGDIDGDGDLDVLSAAAYYASSYAKLTWYEQISINEFVPHILDTTKRYRWATLADFDADGDLDILASGVDSTSPPSDSTTIDLHENIGGGRFIRRVIGPGFGQSNVVAAVDMDGDGDLDAVTMNAVGGAPIAWFPNLNLVDPDYGDAPANYPTMRSNEGAVHGGGGLRLGAVRDVDADGVPTAAADGAADDDGVMLPVVRVGQVNAVVTVNVQNAPAGALLDAWIDFNQDGSWGGAGEQIFASRPVVEGDNELTFTIPSSAISGSAVARFRLSTAGGLRPGGVATDGEVEDYLLAIEPPATSSGEFGYWASPLGLYSSNSNYNFMDTVWAFDVDGDGAPDILDSQKWYRNLGGGAFILGASFTLSGGFRGPVDIDRDGDIDFVHVGPGVQWYENDGAGRFAYHDSPAIVGSIYNNSPVTFADIDGNGLLDVVVIPTSATSLQINYSQGPEPFSSAIVENLSVTGGVVSLNSADVDGDGDLDLFFGLSNGVAAWYEQSEKGWVYHELQPAGASVVRVPYAIAPVDWDRDGDLDLIYLDLVGTQLAIDLYRNDGQQNFVRETLATVVPAGSNATGAMGADRIQVVDLDGDDDFDIVVGGQWGTRVFRNQGANGLVGQLAYSERSDSGAAVAVADFDLDGRLEIVGNSYEPSSSPYLLDDVGPGDYNRDVRVAGSDFLLWQRSKGKPITLPGDGADGDHSGAVDDADLAVWHANYGAAPVTIAAADLKADASINGNDFLALQRYFSNFTTYNRPNLGDLNFDKVVDGADLAIWQDQYGIAAVPAIRAEATLVQAAPLPISLADESAAPPLAASVVLAAPEVSLLAPTDDDAANAPVGARHVAPADRDAAFHALPPAWRRQFLRDEEGMQRRPKQHSHAADESLDDSPLSVVWGV